MSCVNPFDQLYPLGYEVILDLHVISVGICI